MELLEQRILRDGKVKPGGILKVDSFLNHQLDPMLMHEMAKELHRLFDGQGVNKILTIEASGIALAIMTGLEFGCPWSSPRKASPGTFPTASIPSRSSPLPTATQTPSSSPRNISSPPTAS